MEGDIILTVLVERTKDSKLGGRYREMIMSRSVKDPFEEVLR
jgi:hypothetical protein